jgi:hypothetical protein
MTTAREEWTRLADDMRMLASVFGDRLTETTWRDVDVYTAAVECLDRLVDPRASYRARAELVAASIDLLEGGAPALPPELAEKLEALEVVLVRRGAVAPFVAKLREVFACSETLRRVRTRSEYVERTVEEGRLGAELLLSIVGGDLSPALACFIRDIAGPANVVDNLRDATRDHADGSLPLRPGVRLHLRLAIALVRRGIPVVWSSPAPGRFLVWGLHELVLPVARDARDQSLASAFSRAFSRTISSTTSRRSSRRTHASPSRESVPTTPLAAARASGPANGLMKNGSVERV